MSMSDVRHDEALLTALVAAGHGDHVSLSRRTDGTLVTRYADGTPPEMIADCEAIIAAFTYDDSLRARVIPVVDDASVVSIIDRAVALVHKDAQNEVRVRVVDLTAAIVAAQNFHEMQLLVAAMLPLPTLTPAQIRQAIKDKIRSGEAD